MTEKGKDKIMVYNSETDSDEGDPSHKASVRFSSYSNSNKLSSKQWENIKQEINVVFQE